MALADQLSFFDLTALGAVERLLGGVRLFVYPARANKFALCFIILSGCSFVAFTLVTLFRRFFA
jgi:hypothetical protein